MLSSGAGTNCNLSTSSCGTYQYYVGSMSYSGDGTVLGANDSVNGSWTHSYDDLGRILTSTQSGGSAFTFGTDHYGNRANQTLTAGSGPQPSFSVDQYTNKITTSGFTYDAVGNLINDGIHAYKYDAENRIIGVDDLGTTYTARYKYDAAGRRVEKQVSGQDTIDYVYDAGSHAATRIDATAGGTWLGSDIFAAGHLATYTGGTTYFELSDWLGSERVRTNVSGASVETCSNLAYGDNIAASLGPDCTRTDVSPFHFTGYEHDNESGLDHAWFRYYNPRIGRFMTSDLLAGGSGNPQSLNKMTYTGNLPTSAVDSLGLCEQILSDDPCMDGALTDKSPGGGGTVCTGTEPDSLCIAGGNGDPYGVQAYGFGEDMGYGANTFSAGPGAGGTPFGQTAWNNMYGRPCNDVWSVTDTYSVNGVVTNGILLGDTFCDDEGNPFSYLNMNGGTNVNGGTNGVYVSAASVNATKEATTSGPAQSFGSCFAGELVNNFFGSEDTTGVTVALHVAVIALRQGSGALLPGPGWMYTTAAVAWDAAQFGKAYIACHYGIQNDNTE